VEEAKRAVLSLLSKRFRMIHLRVHPKPQATRIVVTSAEDQTDAPSHSVFENVWCLWDAGSQIPFIATHLLDTVVRNNKDGVTKTLPLWKFRAPGLVGVNKYCGLGFKV
jgi:hypothetical protein